MPLANKKSFFTRAHPDRKKKLISKKILLFEKNHFQLKKKTFNQGFQKTSDFFSQNKKERKKLYIPHII
jgi:hypothetical protein